MMIQTQKKDVVMDVPELIPVRMLNEFTYCPRLGYLEWVQGEFRDNLDTIEGRFGHRRVDRPSTKTFSGPGVAVQRGAQFLKTKEEEVEKEGQRIHSRSLMLSAPEEGLIANIDLVDIKGETAVPVDYKHGRIPDTPERAWEPERVQVCAQGLILLENGYNCTSGILYYIDSKTRVTVPFDEALVERTRSLILQFRKAAALSHLPEPLVDSPKCVRCSLVGICLPDETVFLRNNEKESHEENKDLKKKKKPRKLLPARDDALPLYIQEQGASLGKSGRELLIKYEGKVVQRQRLIDTSQVCLFGNVQISAQALRELSEVNVPVCHFSYGGWFHAMTTGLSHKNVELRIQQFAIAADPERSLEIAKRFVSGKIKNCRTLLRRHITEDPARILPRMMQLAQQVEQARSAEVLLGIEGTAARLYFQGFSTLLKGDVCFDLEGRNRRPPRDPVNAVLSFVYSMLAKELTLTVQTVGFDPMLGFFHKPRYGRASLALDLAEEFRPLIADSTVLMLINNGELKESSFISRAGSMALTQSGRRAVLAAFERRMESLLKHPIFGYRISYRRTLEVQTRLLARTVLGELETYPELLTR